MLATYLKLIRPHHWVKNGIIFFPLIFSGRFFKSVDLRLTILTFISFCLAASFVYVINDLVDADKDRLHPTKRNRPIAAGVISKPAAYWFSIVLLYLLILLNLFFIKNIPLASLLGLYLGLNFLYSFFLKHQPVFDIVLVSTFYLIRVFAGAVVIGVQVSGWLFLCIFYFSLFLIAGKRRAESMNSSVSRRVLERYTTQFLESVMMIGLLSGFFTYALYVITTAKQYGTVQVLVASFILIRLLYMALVEDKGEAPEMFFIKDPSVLLAVLVWIGISFYSLYP